MAFRKRSDQHPSTDEIMTEVNSNDTKRKRSRNMIASWILPNKQRIVIGVLISFVLFQIHQLLSSVRLAEIYEVSVQINNSYVDITGIEDLERRSKLIENRCYVRYFSAWIIFIIVMLFVVIEFRCKRNANFSSVLF
mmetsp:Transcript_25811/g.31823  ORF Transcript_25811/g.31823 Transcript_25811/m.31823 type:complete len:137 (+) Transcript_25811:58-468(+)